jgi:hypothetical protein
VNLWSEKWPVHHVAGLSPASLDRSRWVLTSCLSQGKWGKQRVNQPEVLLANNCPEDVAKALVHNGGATDAFVNACPAAGCFISGAQPWLSFLGKKGGTNKTKSSMVVGDNGVDLVGDDTMGPISQQGNERELLWGLEENPSQKGRE